MCQDTKNIRYALAAWDTNGLPIRLKGSMDFSDGIYTRLSKCNCCNLLSHADGPAFYNLAFKWYDVIIQVSC